jgi:DNA-binding beta-propeller fold protein YncE
MKKIRLVIAFLVTFSFLLVSAHAADLIVSANDAKFVRVAGKATYPENPLPDTLTVIDASTYPHKLVATVDVKHSIHGPPQAVAITPDGRLAFVSSPDEYSYQFNQQIKLDYIQVIDLEVSPAKIVNRIHLGSHPQGLSVSPDGKMLLAATVDGAVAVLSIESKEVVLVDKLKVAKGKLSGISFTHDGKAALVAHRDEQGVSVLEVRNGKVTPTGEWISTGVTPYVVDVSSDGKWAVVSNVGLAAIEGRGGKIFGDVDTVTLIDVSHRPFRAVQHITVPSIPEGAAISPDGCWIAVLSMAGSNLPKDNPGRRDVGKIVLFEIKNQQAVKVSEAPSGEASQGVVFTADSQYLLVQMNVEKAIGVYRVDNGKIIDTGERIQLSGGPTSLRSKPR